MTIDLLDLSDLDGFATVIVTSADVTSRPVGRRIWVDVFRRVMHKGIPSEFVVVRSRGDRPPTIEVDVPS